MDKLTKTSQREYDALEKRVTDIFNGACGTGYDAEEWKENEYVTLLQASNIMRAVEKTWGEKMKEVAYSGFEIKYFHCEYFEQPHIAAKWLWDLGIRE